jgi:ubiquinone/menaquinone biosynthesis C-methylase UbiE
VTERAFRDQREFKAWNDAMVAKYDLEQFHNHPSPFVRYVERKRVRRIFALLAPRPGDRVLEIGCGAGHLLAQVPAGRRFGMDLAESLLAKAARRLARRGALLQGDAEHLPFRDRAWERVYCSEVLEHLTSPATALAEMRRIVARGGVAVVSVPNERLINALKAILRTTGLYRVLIRARAGDYAMPQRMDDEWHLHTFDLAGLLALIPAGLRVTCVEGIPFRWLPLRYIVRCEAAESARRG